MGWAGPGRPHPASPLALRGPARPGPRPVVWGTLLRASDPSPPCPTPAFRLPHPLPPPPSSARPTRSSLRVSPAAPAALRPCLQHSGPLPPGPARAVPWCADFAARPGSARPDPLRPGSARHGPVAVGEIVHVLGRAGRARSARARPGLVARAGGSRRGAGGAWPGGGSCWEPGERRGPGRCRLASRPPSESNQKPGSQAPEGRARGMAVV